MNIADVLLWGFLSTVVLTTMMAGASGLGYSRMSIPLLLGTMVTPDRDRAPLAGYLLHLVMGWLFAFLYAAIFEGLGRSGWLLGTALGLLHGLAVLTAAMPVLPALHPRMASERQGPEPTSGLEPPGFLALNYGRHTPLFALVAHLAYGALLGGLYRVTGG